MSDIWRRSHFVVLRHAVADKRRYDQCGHHHAHHHQPATPGGSDRRTDRSCGRAVYRVGKPRPARDNYGEHTLQPAAPMTVMLREFAAANCSPGSMRGMAADGWGC